MSDLQSQIRDYAAYVEVTAPDPVARVRSPSALREWLAAILCRLRNLGSTGEVGGCG